MAAFRACPSDLIDDLWIAIGNCTNVSDPATRKECKEAAREELMEAGELCKEQFEARLEVCEELGEEPYDPDLFPDDFIDPDVLEFKFYAPGIGAVLELNPDTNERVELIMMTKPTI